MPTDMYRGKTALITGASGGIGAGFARKLALQGTHVILVARSTAALEQLAAELRTQHGITATVITADLQDAQGVAALTEQVRQQGLQVDLLINNAGFGTYGSFNQLDPQRDRAQILVNTAALVDLTHAFLPQMLARGEGAIINIASTIAFQSTPYMATYAATKAFVLSFSEALWAEYRGQGVHVMALCPGPTETGFFSTIDNPATEANPLLNRRATVDDVVTVGLRALDRKRHVAIVGRANHLLAWLPRMFPRAVTVRISEMLLRPRVGKSSVHATQ